MLAVHVGLDPRPSALIRLSKRWVLRVPPRVQERIFPSPAKGAGVGKFDLNEVSGAWTHLPCLGGNTHGIGSIFVALTTASFQDRFSSRAD